MKRGCGTLLIAGGFALASVCLGPAAKAADVFTLTSSAFQDNGTIATKNAGNDKSNPNCVGDNVSPPLVWRNPPEGTKSFALLMVDPEGRAPAGVSHMVIYGIPAAATGFPPEESTGAPHLLVLVR